MGDTAVERLRIGNGFDVHRLVSGRPLILGGIEIPYEMGLDGHSDADVLLHAVADALLGAAALGDIGLHFPPDDERFGGADSAGLLNRVRILLEEAGFSTIINIDATVICEKPRLRPYIDRMRQRIADILRIDIKRVGLKATTTEQLGFTGRGEGIAASAVCIVLADV
jgi:2-C-methyl-D-erythritol 2,4-cyclodiphosphate synthase